MEMMTTPTPTIHWSNCRRNLQFFQPLFNFPFSHSSSTTLKIHHRFHSRRLRASNLSQSPNITIPHSLRKSLTAPRSLADNGTSEPAMKVAEFDPSLAVKQMATEISPELKGTSIFLVGMNSAMKTSLGNLLADALRYYYFDSDSLVEEAASSESAAKSFKERDEKGFRESETEVLKQLSSMGRLVVCAGDGAVQSPTNLAFLRHGIAIWIDVPLDMIAMGAIKDGHELPASEESTPGSASEELSQLAMLYEEMRDGYATADATVSLQKVASKLGYDDLDAVTTEDMALEVLMEIQKLTRVKKMMEAAARPF